MRQLGKFLLDLGSRSGDIHRSKLGNRLLGGPVMMFGILNCHSLDRTINQGIFNKWELYLWMVRLAGRF